MKRMPFRCARVFVLVRVLRGIFVSFMVNIYHKEHEEVSTKDRKKHEGVGRVLISKKISNLSCYFFLGAQLEARP